MLRKLPQTGKVTFRRGAGGLIEEMQPRAKADAREPCSRSLVIGDGVSRQLPSASPARLKMRHLSCG
jgi:hypothetical protein